jgi:NAD(P) transhydrogenase
MVAAMKHGSVIVDLAAEAGGNCEATRPGELYVHKGVTIIGYTDLPSRLPTQSSTLYSNNITKFLLSLGADGKFVVDLEDEVVRGSIVVHKGNILEPVPRAMPPPPPTPPITEEKTESVALTPWQKATREVATVTAGMGSVVALGKLTGTAFMSQFFTFGLAGLVGYRVVWGVAPALHSPLMSVTNAISGELHPEYTIGMAAVLSHPNRYGWHRWSVHHGRRILSGNSSSSFGCSICSFGERKRRRGFRHNEANVRHV